MLWHAVILALLVASGSSDTAEKGNLDDLIDDVFGSPARSQNIPNEKPCNNGNGECVPYYLCVDGKINTDGSDLLDIRFGDDKPVKDDTPPEECVDYFEQCCAIGDVLTELPKDKIPEGYEPDPDNPGKVRPKRTKPVDTGTGGPGGPKDPVTQPVNSKCGIRNVEGVGFRITGATQGESEYGEFPWMVAILKEETAADQLLNVYQCGGSLIDRNVVLTAAHCVQGKAPATLKVRAGEWDTQTKNELFPHSDYDVKEVVVHPEFYKGGLHNDIALLFLTKPVEDQPHIGTVCLPPQGHVFDGSRCFASGWGKDVYGREGKYQVILKEIELPIVPTAQCQNSLRQTRLGKYFELHKSFICAGGEPGKDTCKGDGGSPLVCPPAPGKPGSYYQAGIVAWGIGCGEEGTPGAYANVALFRNWIDEQVQLKGFDTSSYTV